MGKPLFKVSEGGRITHAAVVGLKLWKK
jgi:hypothetical protein